MSNAAKTLHPLISAQRSAVFPHDNIWLSASAGTGKTQVLTARVIRLLLENDVEPENLLCITFTKAGASEMADRINQLLASWVQLDDKILFHDLEAIGAEAGPEARKKARQMFAKVLDAPGGGLQILTIHSFCQSLLGSFPEEAGLVPGFKPVEGRELGPRCGGARRYQDNRQFAGTQPEHRGGGGLAVLAPDGSSARSDGIHPR
jgi:ATP-dependent helicase/nuclease subunit A